MRMTEPETVDLRRDGSDVLLFRHAADGTVSLLAVTEEEWMHAVAAEEPEEPRLVTAHRLFAEIDMAASHPGGVSRH